MLNQQDILQNINKVIGYSQEFPMSDCKALLDKWAEAKEDLANTYLGGELIKNFGHIQMTLPKEEQDKQFNKFVENFTYRNSYVRFVDFLRENQHGFFENKVEKEYKLDDVIIPQGMKLVKAFKFFIKDKDELDKWQTEASRIIQCNVLEGDLCVSVHPLDFLSSSENIYNWRSCHALDGEYRSGNLSYMVDKTTMICYIRGNGEYRLPHFPEDVLWNSKKWRMLLFISEGKGLWMAGRQYPFSLGENILNNLIDDLMPNFKDNWGYPLSRSDAWSQWHDDQITDFHYQNHGNRDDWGLNHNYIVVNGEIKSITSIVKDADNSLHFNDLLHSSCYTPLYSWKRRSGEKYKMIIGGAVPCPCCGNKNKIVEESGSMCCPSCAKEYGTLGDDYVRCYDCDTRVHIDDAYWVEEYGDYVCADCFNDFYSYCDNCGEVYRIDDLREDENGNYYCDECIEAGCGRWPKDEED